jgi:hypothetical protein
MFKLEHVLRASGIDECMFLYISGALGPVPFENRKEMKPSLPCAVIGPMHIVAPRGANGSRCGRQTYTNISER